MLDPGTTAIVDRKHRQSISTEGRHRRRVDKRGTGWVAQVLLDPGAVEVVVIVNIARNPEHGNARPIAFQADCRGIARDARSAVDPIAYPGRPLVVPCAPVPVSVPEVVAR